MSLLTPMALWWGLVALPIVGFYILKIRLRRETVATTIFWQQVFEQKQPRSVWQRFRHLFSLLVQLALVALLVAALTRPVFHWELNSARHIVFVIDNSASMNATDVAPSRLAAARAEATHLLERLRYRDEAAIVTCGGTPRVLCGLTSHRRTLTAALAKLAATDSPTRAGDAVSLAQRVLADSPNRRIILLTDACYSNSEEIFAQEHVDVETFGTATNNVAITQFQTRRSLNDPIGFELLFEVSNLGDSATQCRLDLELDERILDVIPLQIPENQSIRRVVSYASTEGGHLRAQLDTSDVLTLDNSAYAIVPSRPTRRVLLVGPSNLFLEKVFDAVPLVRWSRMEQLPDPIPPNTVLVFSGAIPEVIPPGDVFVIHPTTSSDLWELGPTLNNPVVATQDDDSPVLAHVRLDNVLMPEARRLHFDASAKILASSLEDAPLLVEIQRESDRVMVLSVNLEKGDLPLRTAFPILVSNLLSHFDDSRGEFRESFATGTTAEIQLPQLIGAASTANAPGTSDAKVTSSSRNWFIRAPDGTSRPIVARDRQAPIGPLDQVGMWTLTPQASQAASNGNGSFDIAVNLGNREESDLYSDESTRAPRQPTLASMAAEPIWFYLVMVAWLLATLEWFLYQRRWIS